MYDGFGSNQGYARRQDEAGYYSPSAAGMDARYANVSSLCMQRNYGVV